MAPDFPVWDLPHIPDPAGRVTSPPQKHTAMQTSPHHIQNFSSGPVRSAGALAAPEKCRAWAKSAERGERQFTARGRTTGMSRTRDIGTFIRHLGL